MLMVTYIFLTQVSTRFLKLLTFDRGKRNVTRVTKIKSPKGMIYDDENNVPSYCQFTN